MASKSKMSFTWRQSTPSDRIPRQAVQGGIDVGGHEMYVGRAMHCNVMLPAKIIPATRSASVSYNGSEIPVHNYEVLTGKSRSFRWLPASDGNVAPGAISVGEYGHEHLFIGRAPYQSSMTIGKIHPSHRVLYIPFCGHEVPFQHYEVLVSTQRDKNKKDKKKKDRKKKKSRGSSSSSSSYTSSSSDTDDCRKK
ncbi:natterin-3-like [Chironomus tepperi]|uniref:natterin-3-like n=1 Tax=Chironomus tepperi TaxID=113505 RepID=UPI00391EFAD7